jgi:hypothetical protein
VTVDKIYFEQEPISPTELKVKDDYMMPENLAYLRGIPGSVQVSNPRISKSQSEATLSDEFKSFKTETQEGTDTRYSPLIPELDTAVIQEVSSQNEHTERTQITNPISANTDPNSLNKSQGKVSDNLERSKEDISNLQSASFYEDFDDLEGEEDDFDPNAMSSQNNTISQMRPRRQGTSNSRTFADSILESETTFDPNNTLNKTAPESSERFNHTNRSSSNRKSKDETNPFSTSEMNIMNLPSEKILTEKITESDPVGDLSSENRLTTNRCN